jgi:hypothetical protein
MDEQLHNEGRAEHLRPIRHRWNILQTHYWTLSCLFMLVRNTPQPIMFHAQLIGIALGTKRTLLGRLTFVSLRWTIPGLLRQTSLKDKL